MQEIINTLTNTNTLIGTLIGILVVSIPNFYKWNRNGRPGGWTGFLYILIGSIEGIVKKVMPSLVEKGIVKDDKIKPKTIEDEKDFRFLLDFISRLKSPGEKEELIKMYVGTCNFEDDENKITEQRVV